MVCLRNMCINTLHKGDSDDDNKFTASHCNPSSQHVFFSVSYVMLGKIKYTNILLECDAVSTGNCLPVDTWSNSNFRFHVDVFGIATRYGLDRPEIEIIHPASYTMGTVSFPEVKRSGRGLNHLPPSCAEVKERAELYLYFPFGPSWAVLGWALALPLNIETMFFFFNPMLLEFCWPWPHPLLYQTS
jgi:hypothetical protein